MSVGLTQALSGFGAAYAAVQVPMLVGLVRSRAAIQHFVLSPVVAAPLTLMVAVGSAMSTSLLVQMGLTAHGAAQTGIALGVSALLGYAGGRTAMREESSDRTYQRGTRVRERAETSRSEARGRCITLAGLEVPTWDEAKHFKIIGTTGTGKSTAIQEILSAALSRGDRAVIADPDGGYMQSFFKRERGDLLMNPFEADSVKWDLFAEIKTPYDVEQLARSLIPDQDGQDRSWRGYARTFFTAVTRQAHEAGVTDVSELYRLLVAAKAEELRLLVDGTPAQPFLDEHNSRMFDSIRSVTSSAVGALDYIGHQKAARALSVRQWVSDQESGVLFMPYKAGQIAALSSTISAWTRLAIFETMNREESAKESHPLWFIVDELDALGPIDGLKDALARLRKFDGRCVLGFQSVAQVSGSYGRADAHTVVENCGNTLILRCSASEGGGTARFASQLIGDREVLRTTTSKSRRVTEIFGSVSHNRHFSTEAAVLPSQIEQLPDLTGYLKFASDPEWQKVSLGVRSNWERTSGASGPVAPGRARHRQSTGLDRDYE
jgi:type IV secretory pathway TraG/TraD family ATPase VirD4